MGVDEESANFAEGTAISERQQPQRTGRSTAQSLIAETEAPDRRFSGQDSLLEQASRLPPREKVSLVQQLLKQLEIKHIQTILEAGIEEIGDRQLPPSPTLHNTRLVLKKDYSYKNQGLTQPTQYYVYLRRRNPKLDRYIGALFYVPKGCALSYFLDGQERIIFNPPHNTFQLQDSTNSAIIQIVRLICLEPPPPEYTFAKQQSDVPAIYLHLEYLDPKTYQPTLRQSYPFPVCMHEGGKLDRYRWNVSPISVTPETDSANAASELPEAVDALQPEDSPTVTDPTARNFLEKTKASPRRVLELPPSKPRVFYLTRSDDRDAVLKRLRLWVTWSERAMPQARWEIAQEGETYVLRNARFQRQILAFSQDSGAVTLEHSLPVLAQWFHDLSLAVSQAPNRQYSAAQRKLAGQLFVEMSLPQKDPLKLLQKLFGIPFSETATGV